MQPCCEQFYVGTTFLQEWDKKITHTVETLRRYNQKLCQTEKKQHICLQKPAINRYIKSLIQIIKPFSNGSVLF